MTSIQIAVRRLARVFFGAGFVLGCVGLAAAPLANAPGAMGPQVQGMTDAEQAKLSQFDATLQSRQAAIAAGRKASAFCANCHGDDGNSRFPDVPNLAGQHPAYLFTQIHNFANGTRKNAYMEKMIKLIGEEDRLKIVYLYSNSTASPHAASAESARGREVFAKTCSACHGNDAHGMAVIPRLAGQPQRYLELTLESYRNRTGERNFAPMSAVVSGLSAADLRAVIAYLTSAP